jgi:hypothetical protein
MPRVACSRPAFVQPSVSFEMQMAVRRSLLELPWLSFETRRREDAKTRSLPAFAS